MDTKFLCEWTLQAYTIQDGLPIAQGSRRNTRAYLLMSGSLRLEIQEDSTNVPKWGISNGFHLNYFSNGYRSKR